MGCQISVCVCVCVCVYLSVCLEKESKISRGREGDSYQTPRSVDRSPRHENKYGNGG